MACRAPALAAAIARLTHAHCLPTLSPPRAPMALSGLPPAVSGPGDAAAQPPACERFDAAQDADRLRGVLRLIPDEVARSRELLRQRLEAVGGTPPPLVTSYSVVSRDTADVPGLEAEIRRLDAQWQRERAAWQAAEAAATRKAAPPEPANRPLRKRKRPPAPAEGFRRGARAKEDFAAAGRVVEEASESVECWACEREFPRLVKGKVSRVAKGGVCKDCLAQRCRCRSSGSSSGGITTRRMPGLH